MFNLQHQNDTTMLIGRKEELRELNDAFKSEYSEFVAVYGRRRVGKTFLVREGPSPCGQDLPRAGGVQL